MAMKQILAFAFPGQGSQSLGMLSELAEVEPVVRQVFDHASKILGYDVWALAQEGPVDKLDQTEYTQPVLLTADVALWETWRATGGDRPALLAGHSLGEYAALVAAESLSFEDALRLVSHRGQYMQAAVQPGEGAMAAIIGLTNEQVQTLCQEAIANTKDKVSAANYNSIGQVVIAGHKSAVEKVAVMSKFNGARMAKLIPVSVPSHCALMQPAAERLAEDLATVEFKEPNIPVIHNVDVAQHLAAEQIREALVQQLVNPVRWVETVQRFHERGVEVIVECGPGKVLAGLNKRIEKSIATYSIQDPEGLQSTLTLLKESNHVIS